MIVYMFQRTKGGRRAGGEWGREGVGMLRGSIPAAVTVGLPPRKENALNIQTEVQDVSDSSSSSRNEGGGAYGLGRTDGTTLERRQTKRSN